MSAVTSPLDPVVYREGMILKRQRGLKTGNAKKLKFQERFCRLTSASLDYYDPNPKKRGDGPKGQFAVEQIKVVEAMEKDILGKEFPYAFQIGDSTEVMYFVAKSEKDMDEWLVACRHVAKDGGNLFLSHHHHGVFGLANKGRWSCCANPRRACPGCSPSTGLDKDKGLPSTLPSSLTPPTPRSNYSSPTMVARGSPRNTTPSHELETGDDTDSSSEEPMVAPHHKILVRRFTLADPLMMPGTPQKLRELRKTSSVKDDDEDTLTDEQLAQKGAENEKTNNSLNSLNSIGSGGKEEERKREGDDSSKDSVIETMSTGSKGDSSNEVEKKEMKNQNSKRKGGESPLLANCKERTGASSPSPSVDSGRGVSRPNSQIDVVDLRVSRTDSVGKKSVQSVIAEQGAMSHTGRNPTSKQVITEETDGKLDKQVRKTSSEAASDETEAKYKNRGNQSPGGKLKLSPPTLPKPSPPTLPKPTKTTKTSSPAVTSPKNPTSLKSPTRINRKMSSPPAPEILFLQQSMSPGAEDRARPRSFSFVETEFSKSGLSQSVTPQHRKLLANMASSGSPKLDRPRSILKGVSNSFGEDHQPYSRLHQACEDGNLTMLEEELNNKDRPVDLDEPSGLPIPYAPLFIAYIKDHYQVMMSLLEYGANPNCEEPCDKMSLLQWASEKGCYDVIDLLIKYKADVNRRDCFGNSPLMVACRNGHLDVVELLLENGANVDDNSANQRTALHEATEGEHADIAELLLKQSEVDPAVRDNADRTPYDIAYTKKKKVPTATLR